jgi:hypothetical protein
MECVLRALYRQAEARMAFEASERIFTPAA